MNGSSKLQQEQPFPESFSVHPKLFIFFERSTGIARFEVRACQDGTLPIDQAVSLLAVHCLARQKMPRDFGIMIAAGEDLLGHLVARTMKIIRGWSHTRSITPLSRRQDEVLAGITQNLGNKEIAAKLNISERTVKFHVSSLLQKFDVCGRVDLMLEATKMLPHEAVHKRTQNTLHPFPAGASSALLKAKSGPRPLLASAGIAAH